MPNCIIPRQRLLSIEMLIERIMIPALCYSFPMPTVIDHFPDEQLGVGRVGHGDEHPQLGGHPRQSIDESTKDGATLSVGVAVGDGIGYVDSNQRVAVALKNDLGDVDFFIFRDGIECECVEVFLAPEQKGPVTLPANNFSPGTLLDASSPQTHPEPIRGPQVVPKRDDHVRIEIGNDEMLQSRIGSRGGQHVPHTIAA